VINNRLYARLVLDKLNEVNYDASVAGLAYGLSADTEGLVLSIFGYNDKLHILLSNIVHEMKNLVVTKERFEVAKEASERSLRNWSLEDPLSHASYYSGYMLSEPCWTMEELKQALMGKGNAECCSLVGIRAEDVQGFIPRLLSRFHLEAMIHGNVSAKEALQYVDILQSKLKSEPLGWLSVELSRSRLLPTRTAPPPADTIISAQLTVRLKSNSRKGRGQSK